MGITPHPKTRGNGDVVEVPKVNWTGATLGGRLDWMRLLLCAFHAASSALCDLLRGRTLTDTWMLSPRPSIASRLAQERCNQDKVRHAVFTGTPG